MASCADAYKPFDEGDGDVPTATGDPASDLAEAKYTGSVRRTANEGAAVGAENFDFVLEIAGNKIVSAGMFGGLSDVQALKTASGEYNANGKMTGDMNVDEYLKFTVSADGNSVEILEYTASGSSGGQNFKFTYKGTLAKETETP